MRRWRTRCRRNPRKLCQVDQDWRALCRSNPPGLHFQAGRKSPQRRRQLVFRKDLNLRKPKPLLWKMPRKAVGKSCKNNATFRTLSRFPVARRNFRHLQKCHKNIKNDATWPEISRFWLSGRIFPWGARFRKNQWFFLSKTHRKPQRKKHTF